MDTSLLYPADTDSASDNRRTRQARRFFAPVPADQVLALAAARQIKRADAMLLLALLAHKRRPEAAVVFPKQGRLASQLRCSVRTVQRGLDRLVAAGLIVKIRCRTAEGRLTPLRYDLSNLLALLPSQMTRVSPGAALSSRPPAPRSPALPTRQPCRPELESESVVIEINNSPPAPPAPASDTPVVRQMLELGVLPRLAHGLAAAHGEARCAQVVAWVGQRDGIRDRAAWLFRCLSEGWTLAAPVRPRCQQPFVLPRSAAVTPPPADPLDRLSPEQQHALEHAARAQLLAELPVLRPVLEKGRRAPALRLRMRALLAAGAVGTMGDDLPPGGGEGGRP